MNINSHTAFTVRFLIIIFWISVFCGILIVPVVIAKMQKQKTINLLTWAATIDPQRVRIFEQEANIKVNINYFESNEELFVKMATSQGKGYDLLLPSNYILKKLIQYKLLKPIDKSRVTFLDKIAPRMMHHDFDSENNYSIPYSWGIYGIGINKELMPGVVDPSWSLLFSPMHGRVGMIDAAVEAMLMATVYLFGNPKALTYKNLDPIKQLLIQQKKYVEAYIDADVRSNYMLISHNASCAIASTPYISKAMKEYDYIDFIVPREGSFMVIDSFVISAACQEDEHVYQFINFMFRPENIKHHMNQLPFFPTTRDVEELMKQQNVSEKIIDAYRNQQTPIYFFENIIEESIANEVWITVKTS